jgi:hypothetical protein
MQLGSRRRLDPRLRFRVNAALLAGNRDVLVCGRSSQEPLVLGSLAPPVAGLGHGASLVAGTLRRLPELARFAVEGYPPDPAFCRALPGAYSQ